MNTKITMKKWLNYAKNIALSLALLFAGLFLFPVIATVLFLKITDPVAWHTLATLAPVVIDNGSAQLVISFFVVSPYAAFIIWIIRDSRNFKAKGIDTHPYLWGIGMIFPLIFVAFPVYLTRRNVIWLKEREKLVSKNENTAGLWGWYNRTNFITKNTKMKINKGLNVLKWTVVVLVGAYGLLVLFRIPFFIENKKTEEQVAKIHSTKLTMDDVMGKYLPPDPGAEADKTVAGIDANNNGIRDDVELAIFKEYPNSAKTRVVLLQYALALQMEMIQPIVNAGTVDAVDEQNSRGYLCIGKILSRDDISKYVKDSNNLRNFVEKYQLNTEPRKNFQKIFYEHLTSGEVSNKNVCDVDLATLVN